MNSPLNKSSTPVPEKSLLPVQAIVTAAIVWGVLALLFFLLFSTELPGADGVPKRASWYLIGTYVFEEAAFLGASILCLRNWGSPNIVSGRNVWLGIGLGLLSYFLGTLLFGYWELGLHINPDVSPGDAFYIATYLFLGWGMFLAVRSRRLNLERWQWAIVAAIAIIGSLLAWVISYPPSAEAQLPQPAAQEVKVVDTPTRITLIKAAIQEAPKKLGALLKPSTSKAVSPAESAEASAPAWADELEQILKPFGPAVNLLYVIFDVVLLILATMLLLAFWGGRFSQSWRMIAAAAFSLYIADMWFKYANNHIPNYQSGALLEVFWVLSAVLFAIGAALEYDTSSRSRRTMTRKRA